MGDKMRKAACCLALIGAVAVVVGVFLPWVGSQGAFLISHVAQLSSDTHALIVVISSVVMLLCALVAFILSLKFKGDNGWIVVFGIMISLAAVAAIGGLIWFLIDMSGMDNWFDYIGYVIYVCGVGAVLGLISGVLMVIRKKEKRAVRP
jgi:surface polysaccharide O-acyltransferase-like enzyme